MNRVPGFDHFFVDGFRRGLAGMFRLTQMQMFEDFLDNRCGVDEADDLHFAPQWGHSSGSTSQSFLLH